MLSWSFSGCEKIKCIEYEGNEEDFQDVEICSLCFDDAKPDVIFNKEKDT